MYAGRVVYRQVYTQDGHQDGTPSSDSAEEPRKCKGNQRSFLDSARLNTGSPRLNTVKTVKTVKNG